MRRAARGRTGCAAWIAVAIGFPVVAMLSTTVGIASAAVAKQAPAAPPTAVTGAPAGFASAPDSSGRLESKVTRGPVDAVVRVEPKAPRIGDTLTLTLDVSADPEVEVLMPEFGRSLDRFRIVDFVPHQSVGTDGRTHFQQVYTLEPPASGRQVVPPIMIEFVDHRAGKQPAPEGEDAYELVTERIVFEVAPVVPEPAAADLDPPKGKLDPNIGSSHASWWWALLALAALPAAFWGLRILASRRRHLRRLSAYQRARAKLDALSAGRRPGPDAVERFYVQLSAIVRDYLEDRFGLRAPELTTEEFLAEAGRSADLSQGHQALLNDFLRRADMVKFARLIPEADELDAAVKAASRFLEETREPAASHARTVGEAEAAGVC